MPYNKLNISGAQADILAWVNHALSTDEHNMLRNVSRLPCLYKHVALMPDAHLGIGSMVGSVIATKDAVIPATVGVDIGCFTGDTLVPTLDGKSYSLKELAEDDKEIVVYACAENGKVVAAKATAKKTRTNAELVKVILDNGAEIRCTPDHKFMLRDGSFTEAKDLKSGESLMPFYHESEFLTGAQSVPVAMSVASTLKHPLNLIEFEGEHHFRASRSLQAGTLALQSVALQSVKSIAEREDVYCLTVPEYHNFALEAGVFVHNCGMMAVKTPFESSILDGKLKDLRHQIERTIPVGFSEHKDAVDESNEWNAWSEFGDLHKGVQHRKAKAMKQLGTLGGGNHFVEVCLDTDDNVWLMLHSGSRNIGNEIATRHIETAKSLHKLSELPDPNLAYFIQGTDEFKNYWHDLEWAQSYAMKNREVMMKRLVYQFNRMFNDGEDFVPEIAVNCHHNYCIPDTEIIPTPAGPKRISQLKIGSTVYAFDEKKGLVKTKVVGKIYSGKKKIYTIKTTNRSIRVSGEHPILTVAKTVLPHPQRNWHNKTVGGYEWKKAADIIKGDIVVCSKGYYNSTGKKSDTDKARFIGAFLGDGWLRQKTRQGYTVGLAIGGLNETVTEKYFDLLQTNLFPKANWNNNVAGAFGLTCSSKQVYEQIQHLKIGCKSREKFVPDYCFRWSLDNRLALLAGYLDADGCVTHSGGKVASASKSLAEGLRELAISCGFHCSNINFTNRITNYGKNPLYCFFISSNNLSELNIWHETKRSKIKIPPVLRNELSQSKIGYLELPKDFYCQKVIEIQFSEAEEDVYDIEVDSANHSFICEGIVVHNCALEKHFGDEVYITRKGAIRADQGMFGIIPGSMGAKSFIIKGLGNAESFNSCSHGAGRKMSRTAAKKRFSREDLERQTAGVECRKDKGVIDEIPGAYKNIDEVMRNQSDLVEIVAELKQLVCVKG
ncbi:hypothetical protein BH20ACI1_BH20ACI1_01180 [soil metagenome]